MLTAAERTAAGSERLRLREPRVRAVAQEQRVGAGRTGLWTKLKGFFRDSWLELQKVIWPSGEEVVKMTGLVVAVVFVVGIFIYLWDRILWTLTRRLFE
jgi:preprotein translocase SecE subunit